MPTPLGNQGEEAPAAGPAPARGLGSKAQPCTNLKRARTAGSKRLADALVRFPERRGHDEVVVEIRKVRDVEDVEAFADETKIGPRPERDRLRHAEILR